MVKKTHKGILQLTGSWGVWLFLIVLLTGCAAQDELAKQNVGAVEVKKETKPLVAHDPYENFNRGVYNLNRKIDRYLFKPVADTYSWATPDFMKTGVRNFFSNMKDINVFVNALLQGKLQQGGEDFGRLLVNSTLGLGGLFDVASDLGLEKHEEDFAQTLAVWGIPQGPYLVLPVVGPTTARGLPGGILDTAANPMTYVGLLPIQAISAIDARANAEGPLKFIDEAALDPYVFTREAFLQNQEHLISDGKTSVKAHEEFDIESEVVQSLDANASGDAGKTQSGSEQGKTTLPPAAPPAVFDSANDGLHSFEDASSKLDRLIEQRQAKKKRHHRRLIITEELPTTDKAEIPIERAEPQPYAETPKAW